MSKKTIDALRRSDRAIVGALLLVAAIAVSAVALGGLGTASIDMLTHDIPRTGYLIAGGVGLAGALWLSLSERNQIHLTAGRLRSGLIALSLLGVTMTVLLPNLVGRWVVVPIFLIALFEEVLGRWLFYEHLHQRLL